VRIWTKKAAREIRLDGPQALPVLQALQKCLRKQSAEAASELNALITSVRMMMEKEH
jgi:hypothetical protein